MANYEKHPEDDNKFRCPECDYGHGEGNGKSRQGVSMHFKKKHTSQETEEIPASPLLEEDKDEPVDDSTPEWLNFDMSSEENEEATVSISPIASTLLRGMVSEEVVPKTAQAMREYYKQQGKMMRWIFSGFVDPVFKWWGRSITADETFDIKRTSSDWELFEDASTAWLEYHSMSIPVTPDMVMIGTVGTFYAPVIASIHRKRDPSRVSLFARWKTRRALKRALKSEGVETS